ncbi:hypothetical protein AcV7_005525 [Taiwanofungus camphoratus]|nr:hypothetical protein AcV7_005525 [Antrodia cinnamomea]
MNISLTIPDDRLCPPVSLYAIKSGSSRKKDIVEATFKALNLKPEGRVKGIDIGTGASAIYPLLGCRTDPRWSFVATDVDEKSLSFARLNVRRNGLEGRISVMQSDIQGPILLPLFERRILRHASDEQLQINIASTSGSEVDFDFIMCNPPFYSSREDMVHSAEAKEFGATAVCTGADIEMITPGGEGVFVSRMIRESVGIGSRCRWYTSMLGKMSSLIEVVALLREHKIENYGCTEFVQGQTRRWAIAWSFGDIRLPDPLARIGNPSLRTVMPARNTLQQTYPQAPSTDRLADVVSAVLGAIDHVSVHPLFDAEHGALDLIVSAALDTWSRAARRKVSSVAMETDGASSAALVCLVKCISLTDSALGQMRFTESPVLQFNWLRGRERRLYESFASHIGRKVTAALAENTDVG